MKPPLFILGCHRSGTTLLSQLLKHTTYGAPVESHFITKYYKKLGAYGDITDKKNFSKLLKAILSERPVMQWKLDINVDQIFEDLQDIDYVKIIDSICLKRAGKDGKNAWGDKTPDYTLDTEIIYKLFPDAKFIYIVRDGRDVALSLLEKPWGPNNFVACAEYWKKYDLTEDVYNKLKSNKQLFFLRYEDLLTDSGKMVKEVYNFLEEDAEKEEVQKLVQKIRPTNFNKWKNKMSRRQIEFFERTAGKTLKKFGYETSYDEKPLQGMYPLLFSLHDSIYYWKFMFRQNVIDTIKIKFFGKEPFAE